MHTATNYSQYGEQEIFLPLLPETGLLLEIGAYHPTVFSNSRALIEKGWKAVLVEMSPGPLKNLIVEYDSNPNVTIYAGAVTHNDFPELIEFNLTDDAVSTNDSGVHKTWEKVGGYYGKAVFHAIPVKALFSGAAFDFVSVDTEGSSLEVAQAVIVEHVKRGFKIPVMCIEHDSRFDILDMICKAFNLVQVFRNGCNAIVRPR